MRWTLLLLWALTGSAQPPVTVLLYDEAGLGRPILAEMKREASRILLRGGIDTVWVECGAAAADPGGEESTIARIVLRLLTAHDGNPNVLGKTVGARVWLFTHAIAELAARAQWQFSDLLGHAAAHEFGHVLLGDSHAHSGVMRTQWSAAALRLMTHGGLTFRPGELRPALSNLVRKAPERGDCLAPAAPRPRN